MRYKKVVNVRLHKDTYEYLSRLAVEKDLTVSKLIRDAIKFYKENHNG